MARYVDEMITRFLTEGLDSAVGAFDKMAGGAGKYNQTFRAAMEYALPRMGQWGDQARMMAGEWGTAYKEAEKVEARLNALGAQRGMSPEAIASIEKLAVSMMKVTGFDDEAIKTAAVNMMNFGMSAEQVETMLPLLARQALTLGTDIESMGMAMGKGFGTANLGALKRMGVTIDDAAYAQWKLLSRTTDWSNAADVAKLRSIVLTGAMKGLDATTVELGARAKTTEGQLAIMAVRQGEVKELLGEGATKVNDYKRSLAGLFLTVAEGNPSLTKFAGGAVQIGGDLFKVIGVVGDAAHGINEISRSMRIAKGVTDTASLAKKGLAAATKADSAAELAKVGVAKQEAAALLGTANAARTAAAAKGGLAGAGFMGRSLTVGGAVMSAGAGGLLGYAGAGYAGTGGAQSAAVGAGSVIAGAGAGGAVAGPMGAVIGGVSALVTGLYRIGAETSALNRQTREARARYGREEDAAAGFYERYNRARARARRTANGDLHLTVRGAGLGNQQARDYVQLR